MDPASAAPGPPAWSLLAVVGRTSGSAFPRSRPKSVLLCNFICPHHARGTDEIHSTARPLFFDGAQRAESTPERRWGGWHPHPHRWSRTGRSPSRARPSVSSATASLCIAGCKSAQSSPRRPQPTIRPVLFHVAGGREATPATLSSAGPLAPPRASSWGDPWRGWCPKHLGSVPTPGPSPDRSPDRGRRWT